MERSPKADFPDTTTFRSFVRFGRLFKAAIRSASCSRPVAAMMFLGAAKQKPLSTSTGHCEQPGFFDPLALVSKAGNLFSHWSVTNGLQKMAGKYVLKSLWKGLPTPISVIFMGDRKGECKWKRRFYIILQALHCA